MLADFPSHSAEVASVSVGFQLIPSVDDAEMRRPELQLPTFGTMITQTSSFGGRYHCDNHFDNIRSENIVNREIPDVI